ncbi:hypothetical protein LINPERHAP2_LOCUS21739 [Linum perenne]
MAARLLSEVNGLMYRTEADRQWYVRKFRTRPLLPNLRHFPHAFEKYGMNVYEPLFSLGWSNLLPSCTPVCFPDPVRMFYANIRVTYVFPLELETQVLGHFIRLTPQLLSRVYGGCLYGHIIHNEVELAQTGFSIDMALSQLHIFAPPSVRPIPIRYLNTRYRVLFFYITRHFLPRTHNLTNLLPLDIWILYNAFITKHPISLPHLQLQVLHDAASVSYTGALPLGSFVTSLLQMLNVDLQISTQEPQVYLIRPQHILRKLDAYEAHRVKSDISKGGEQDKGKGVSFCCPKGQISMKLNLLASSIKERNDWTIPTKALLECSLHKAIQNFVGALKFRGDWEIEDLQALELGEDQLAKDVKELILATYEKGPEKEDASDYESDPEVDF